MEILKVKELEFSYPGEEKNALDKINLSIEEGEFVLICGQSGCGKSTLLRHLKPALMPFGDKSGDIYYYGKNIKEYEERILASEIGYVMQNPDAQIVTDKVWHELAFGLENLGLDTETIRIRVAEMASFFGIQGWFRKNVSELSGGQKQILNLAAIMVMQPKVLILDEPTSQLDPIAAKNFIDTLVRINKELSTTIIITEHNLEEIFYAADKVIVMEKGNVLLHDEPRAVIEGLFNNKSKMAKAMPTPSKIYYGIREYSNISKECPLTVKKGKQLLNSYLYKSDISEVENNNDEVALDITDSSKEKIALELKDVWFQYKRSLEPVLRNVSLKVHKGEIYSILGGNGTGKTTTLGAICKQHKVQRGKIIINNKELKKYKNKELFEENLAMLPQNPQVLFVHETLREDLEEVLTLKNKDRNTIKAEINRVSELFKIEDLLNKHPYDLSGGEIQRAGLAKIMLLNPKIILLDEPTKGLDAYFKEEIGEILLKLKQSDITIVLVSHDIEFSARYSDKCAMFFDGNIVCEESNRKFFLGNNFYTTVANRISKGIFKDALLYEEVTELWKSNVSLVEKRNL